MLPLPLVDVWFVTPDFTVCALEWQGSIRVAGLVACLVTACSDRPASTTVEEPVVQELAGPSTPRLDSGDDLSDWLGCLAARPDPPWWGTCARIGERVLDGVLARFDAEGAPDPGLRCQTLLTWPDYLPERAGVRERLAEGCRRVWARQRREAERKVELARQRHEERLLRELEGLESLPIARASDATWRVRTGPPAQAALVRLELPADPPDGRPVLEHHWIAEGRRSCVAPDEPADIEDHLRTYEVGARSGSTVVFEITPHAGGTLTLAFR